MNKASTDPLLQPNIGQDEDEAPENEGLTEMVNISDSPIVVRISVGLGRQQKITVKPGKSHSFASAYCMDVPGPGKQMLLPILTRQSLAEDSVPRLVRKEQAKEARERFERKYYGTQGEAVDEVRKLEAQLKDAKARRAVVDKTSKAKGKGAAKD